MRYCIFIEFPHRQRTVEKHRDSTHSRTKILCHSWVFRRRAAFRFLLRKPLSFIHSLSITSNSYERDLQREGKVKRVKTNNNTQFQALPNSSPTRMGLGKLRKGNGTLRLCSPHKKYFQLSIKAPLLISAHCDDRASLRKQTYSLMRHVNWICGRYRSLGQH